MADFHSFKNALSLEDNCSHPTGLQCKHTASLEQILGVFFKGEKMLFCQIQSCMKT